MEEKVFNSAHMTALIEDEEGEVNSVLYRYACEERSVYLYHIIEAKKKLPYFSMDNARVIYTKKV